MFVLFLDEYRWKNAKGVSLFYKDTFLEECNKMALNCNKNKALKQFK
jgi:hypothetical protein